MAFVGISHKLCDDVNRVIGKMCEAECKSVAATEDGSYHVANDNDWFVTKSWGANLHLRSLIPDDWKRSDSNYARFRVNTPDFGEFLIDVSLDARLNDLPPKYESYNAFTVDEHDESIPAVVKGIVATKRARAEIEKRWNGIQLQVSKFLQNCKSLNEGLKLWPELEHYIPSEYVERVLEKRASASKSTSKAAEILSGIDTQGVMAAAVIARMSGATV